MLLLFCVLVFAAYQDTKTSKVSNWVILLGTVLGIAIQMHFYGIVGIIECCITCVIPFFILYPFFKIGVLGAGDIKLFMMMGCYMYLTDLLTCVFLSFLIALIPAFYKMYQEEKLKERIEYLISYLGQAVKSKQFSFYQSNQDKSEDIGKTKIHMTIPILISVLLHLGGVY